MGHPYVAVTHFRLLLLTEWRRSSRLSKRPLQEGLPMNAIQQRAVTRVAQWTDFKGNDHGNTLADESPNLGFSVLRTASERQAIAHLRKQAAFGVEADLDLQLAEHEARRDDIGVVTAVSLGNRVIATLRFVPTGFGMTAAERLRGDLITDTSFLGDHSWEVGRVIMSPEDRHPELLYRCVSLTLTELMRMQEVRYFHASTTLPMARLWRRFGMRTLVTMGGLSGKRYALVCGRVGDVADALRVDDVASDLPTGPVYEPQPGRLQVSTL